MKQAIKVNSIVELLAARRPSELVSLRARFPDQHDLLSPGLVMGPSENKISPVFCELARSGLDTADREITIILNQLSLRAIRAKNVRLLSGVISAIATLIERPPARGSNKGN
jgi:hypothetical protein